MPPNRERILEAIRQPAEFIGSLISVHRDNSLYGITSAGAIDGAALYIGTQLAQAGYHEATPYMIGTLIARRVLMTAALYTERYFTRPRRY